MQDPDPMMVIAIEEARAAAAGGEVPVGAVLARNGEVIARARNRIEEAGDPLAHAEILVLREGAALLGRHGLGECDFHVTLEPCPMCAHAISLARVRRLFFGAWDAKGGGVENGPRIFEHASAFHRPEIFGGVAEKKSVALLKAFFEGLRA